MKSSMKRMLALILSLMLLMPALAEDTEQILQPEQEVVLEELVNPEEEELDDVELELDDGIPVDLSVDDLLEVPEIEDIDVAVVDVSSEEPEENGELADNAGETVSVHYIDAKGRDQGPVTCNKLKPGNENRNMGDGWYAVTENVSYDDGIIVFGKANLILCDGATLTDTDGIWVQEKASLTI